MMKKFNILFLATFFILTSCISMKEVRYSQPNENLALNSEGLISYENMPKYRITKLDILKLNIITTPKGDAAQFYSSMYAQQNGGSAGSSSTTNGSESSFYFNGLKLDENGDIYIFGIGKMKAEGKTTEQLSAEIQERVNENFLPEKSEVRIFLEGIKYTFLYDLNGKSMQKVAQENSINIYEAIAENGGLDRTIDRKNVIVYRKFPEGIKKAQIDLTREDLQNSPYFWLQNGDLVMFNTKPKSLYGFGKEPIQTLTTGVTILSTALSIYLLFSKL